MENLNLKNRRNEIRFRVMSKYPRKNIKNYMAIIYTLTGISAVLAFSGSVPMLFLGASLAMVALRFAYCGHWESWFIAEKARRETQG